jgi:hypothetical protein
MARKRSARPEAGKEGFGSQPRRILVFSASTPSSPPIDFLALLRLRSIYGPGARGERKRRKQRCGICFRNQASSLYQTQRVRERKAYVYRTVLCGLLWVADGMPHIYMATATSQTSRRTQVRPVDDPEEKRHAPRTPAPRAPHTRKFEASHARHCSVKSERASRGGVNGVSNVPVPGTYRTVPVPGTYRTPYLVPVPAPVCPLEGQQHYRYVRSYVADVTASQPRPW